MSKRTNGDTASRDRTAVEDRLARLLNTPGLARVVPHLAPETLHQLIRVRGLDACGEILTSATAAQLTSLLDLDLWRRAPGSDDRFDVRRFGEWLEVLVDAGASVAARTVAALDKRVMIAGLSRYLRVFDPGTFEPTAASDDEAADRHAMMNSETSGDLPECEVGGYLVRARRTAAWDAIVALLVTLDAEYNDNFHALMRGCRRLSNSTPEIDGLDELLRTPEQHLLDTAIEREQRRSRRGYVTSADARAFLHMARQPRDMHQTIARNRIVTSCFRDVDDEGEEAANVATRGADEISASITAIVELLNEAGVQPAPPRALLEAADEHPASADRALLRRLMTSALQYDEAAYLARGREMAFLANTLIAGCSVQSRAFTPGEASDAAASVCNLGLDCWPETASLPDTFLVDHDVVTVFEVGWSVLYRDVSLFAADRLISMLPEIHGFDAGTRRELHALQRALVKQREAGTPWRARDAADVLATLDATAWIGVLGLLDECPILPAALTAIIEGHTTPVSPTAFEFVSTRARIGDVRLFLRMLPAVLSRP